MPPGFCNADCNIPFCTSYPRVISLMPMPAKSRQRAITPSLVAGDKNRRWTWLILGVIVLVGALLRLIALRQSPPGLNQDEAANAWNAYCLLKTGMDQHGVKWPIFYGRFFGGYSSMLYVYWMMPFEALGG